MDIFTHINILVMSLLLPLGTISIVHLFRFYRRYRHPYLLSYGLHLLYFTVIILLSIINNYVFANLLRRFSHGPAIWVEAGYRLSTSILMLIWVYLAIALCRQLLQLSIPKWFKFYYLGITVFITAFLSAFSIIAIQTDNGYIILFADVLLNLIFDFIIIGIFIHFLVKSKTLEPPDRQQAVRVFGSTYLLAFFLLIVFSFLHVFDIFSNNMLLIAAELFLLVTYGMPLLYLKRFMEMYHGPQTLQPETPQQPDHTRVKKLFEKYNISKREQEVIGLICKGKTNKEIEDLLFISLQTVKDHVYSIYRKTGVRNRVELTNLFRLN